MAYSGSCACGRIKFTVDGEISSVTWCYCVTCQQQSGAPFISFANIEKRMISWTKEPDIWSSSKIAQRYFCKECGSTAGMWYFCDPDGFSVPVGIFDDRKNLAFAPRVHIFLKDKPAWFQVPEDGAVREEGFGKEYTGMIEEFEKKLAAAK